MVKNMLYLLFLITWLLIINEGIKTRREIMAKIDDAVKALETEWALDIQALANQPSGAANDALAARITAITTQLAATRASITPTP